MKFARQSGRFLGALSIAITALAPSTGVDAEEFRGSDGGKRAHMPPFDPSDWLNNEIGLGDTVPAPWTPMQSEMTPEGHWLARCWGREYRFGEDGQLLQVSSQGKQVLADPIRVDIQSDRGAVRWQSIKAAAGEANQAEVSYAAEADSPNLQMKTSISVAFDGLVRYRIRLEPKQSVTIKSLKIEVPVSRDIAQLYSHHHLGTTHHNHITPQEYFSAGPVTEAGWAGTFTPALWVGNEKAGVQWLCESTQQWHPRDRQDMMQIRMDRDAAVIAANVITEPQVISQPWEFEFALLVTPVRPGISRDRYAEFSATQIASPLAARNILEPAAHLDAHGRPMTKLDEAVAAGLRMVIVHQHWTELQGYPGTLRADNDRHLRAFVKEAKQRGLKVVVYLGADVSTSYPEWEEYGEKMKTLPRERAAVRKDPPGESSRPCGNRLYGDMLVHHAAEMLRRYDIDGFYLDGTANLRACYNDAHGHGWVDESGQRIGTYGIFDVRETMLRLYRLVHGELRDEGILYLHGGNPFLPSYTFCDVQLGGEYLMVRRPRELGVSTLKEAVPLEFMRAAYSGTPFGIPYIVITKPARGQVTCTMAATVALLNDTMVRFRWPQLETRIGEPLMVDNERMFRVWQVRRDFNLDDCDWLPYWDQASPFKTTQEDIKVSGHLKYGEKLMLVVSNVGTDPLNAEIYLDPEELGLPEDLVIFDALDFAPYPVQQGRITVPLRGENFKILMATKHSKGLNAVGPIMGRDLMVE